MSSRGTPHGWDIWGGTHERDTWVGNMGGTHGWDTWVGHMRGTLGWETLVGHMGGTHHS